MPTSGEKRARFRALHESGCFVLPNPWDVGSAVALESLGFSAIASTSAGMAWSMGRADNHVTRDEVLAHLTALAARTAIPLNADFENGFADDPADVSENVALAVATGVAGLSIEDSSGDAAAPLYDFDLAVARIAAARAAIDASGEDVILTARSEGFIAGWPDLEETTRRLVAFADSGADCLYAPGLRTEDQIAAVIAAVAPKPVNVLAPGLPVAALAALGARRISVGGALARVAWGAFLASAKDILDSGSFGSFAAGASGYDLNRMFGG